MNEADKKQLKDNIEEKKAKLQKKIEELEELCKPISPDESLGRLSRMDAINNRAVNERALENNKAKLSRLEQALEKIDDPEFGICKKCGKPISPGRLTVMPEATRCVSCVE